MRQGQELLCPAVLMDSAVFNRKYNLLIVEGQFVWVAFHYTRSCWHGVWWRHLSWANCSSTRISNEASQHHHTDSMWHITNMLW